MAEIVKCPRCGADTFPSEIDNARSCLIHGEFYIHTAREMSGLRKDPLMQQRKLSKNKAISAARLRKIRADKRSRGECYDRHCTNPSVNPNGGRCADCIARRKSVGAGR